MEFVKAKDMPAAAQALGKRLGDELSASKKVLWLVPGGSNITAAVQIMKSLSSEQSKNLAIMLTDERYGEVGHKDSNLQQLHDAGFTPKNATMVPVLAPGLDLEQTRARYEEAYDTATNYADCIIGLFGMGADGHIAGILPGSPAVSEERLAAAYEAPPYTRVTLTFPAIRHLTAAYLLAFGAEKRPMLENLQSKTLELTKQPAQILKELPEAYIYNDQIGEEPHS